MELSIGFRSFENFISINSNVKEFLYLCFNTAVKKGIKMQALKGKEICPLDYSASSILNNAWHIVGT